MRWNEFAKIKEEIENECKNCSFDNYIKIKAMLLIAELLWEISIK